MIPPCLTPVILNALRDAGETAPITRLEKMRWGRVSTSYRIVTRRRSYLLKYHESPPPGMFSREQRGLALLRAAGARVPEVLAAADAEPSGDRPGYCIQEWVEARSGDAFARRLGARLGEAVAALHAAPTDMPGYGDGRGGAVGWHADWPACFREQRLSPLVARCCESGALSSERRRGVEKLLERLNDLLAGVERRPSLLHGDLHARNVLCDREGAPVLIDPVAHYGDREMELAYTMHWGSFAPGFYQAYEAAWPLPEGWRERRDVYVAGDALAFMAEGDVGYGRQLDAILHRYVGYAALT